MSIEGGQKYDAEVLAAKFTESSGKGTPGVWINFELFDATGKSLGTKSKTCYLTLATKDRFEKDMNTLGVPSEALGTDEFYDAPVRFMSKPQCAVVTEDTTWNDAPRVEIKWINSRSSGKVATADKVALAKSIFATVSQEMGGYTAPGLVDELVDEDVPF